MATRICPDVLNDCNPCAGEFPWENLSAELAEPYVFVSPHIVIVPPPLGKFFTQLGCKRWCYSFVSQAEADLCAIAQARECATVDVPQPPIVPDPPDPPAGFPQVSVFATSPATSFGEAPGVFNISRTGSLSQPLSVQFTLSGEAQNGVDYDTLPYAVTIDAGDSNVDVIVVPMETGETISKSAILTVLGGSNYSPGASSSDAIEIGPQDCGTPTFKVQAWSEAFASVIANLMPNADGSDLPEWDGIFRQGVGSTYHVSNADCYAIAGKRIQLVIIPNQSFLSIVDCPPGCVGCPPGWVENLPGQPGCFSCFSGTANTFITSDYLGIDDGKQGALILGNQSSGIIGDYRFHISAYCAETFLGAASYHLEGGVANFRFGDLLLSVIDL